MNLLKIILAFAAFAAVMRFGMMLLRGLATPHPPPPPGEVRRVNLRFKCSVCLAEIRMVQATTEVPEPPRHCMEEMDLIPAPFE